MRWDFTGAWEAIILGVPTWAGQRAAKALGELKPGGLELPPCIPVAQKIHATSSHPHRVPIQVATRVCLERSGGRRERQDDTSSDVAMKTHRFCVHPEYKLPSEGAPGDAVAAGKGPTTRHWVWKGDASLAPFWAIPRLSADDLKKKNVALQRHETFNMELKQKQYSVVTVGDVNGLSIATTWTVTVPMLTNPEGIAAGESFLLEMCGKTRRSGEAQRRRLEGRRGCCGEGQEQGESQRAEDTCRARARRRSVRDRS